MYGERLHLLKPTKKGDVMFIKIKQLFISPASRIIYSLFLFAVLSASSVSAETLSVSINHGYDDVEEKEKGGSIYFNSSDLELVKDNYNKQKKQTVGLRFNNINLPQGTSISSAYIEFTVDETDSKSIDLKITGHAVDDAPPFNYSPYYYHRYDVSSRLRTSARVDWQPEAWSTIGEKKQTPDLTDIVQEIVDRPGWLANNSMVIIINNDKGKSKRVADSYDGSVSRAPKLVIVYETADTVSVLPIIDLYAAVIVDDEPKKPGTFQLVSDSFPQDTGVVDMGIETRGSTSQEFDKKSFSIELVEQDDPTDELKMTLLDLRKDGDWITDASYRDTSFVRNIIGHDIFNDMRPYAFIDENGVQKGQAAIRGHLSEVYLNNSYNGVYVLEEKVDRKLLGLKKISVPEDANGNEVFDQIDFSDPENGSVLYKADSNLATLGNLATARIDFEQKYPKIKDVARWEPLEELISFITTSSDSEFIANIGNMVEIDSAVDYWLLMNVIADTDSFKKNYYIARSGSGKFFFVPWDNDASFGMAWDGARDTDSINFFQSDTSENMLLRRLFNLPQTGFIAKAKLRWNELRNTLFSQPALVARFESYHILLDAEDENGDSARDRNLARWPGSGNVDSGDIGLGNATSIGNWLDDHLEYLDNIIPYLPE
jgi:hypothetical protein